MPHLPGYLEEFHGFPPITLMQPTRRVGKTTYLWYIANPDDLAPKP